MSIVTELLSVSEMYLADDLAIKGGVQGIELMEAAGAGIASVITDGWAQGRCLVLCGPGNNGGDGYVVARLLRERGWQVDVLSTVDTARLKGDAAHMCGRWSGKVLGLSDLLTFDKYDIIVDGVFGAGFSRILPVDISSLFSRIKDANIPVVAIDVPSGVNGDTGQVDKATLTVEKTVTFFRAKPGHYLYPGRAVCGELHVVDIGIEETVLGGINPPTHVNDPTIWKDSLPVFEHVGHKYSRGHAAIVGGGIASTGAARLAARAALRAGAGAVTVVSPPFALVVYAAALEAVMTTSIMHGDDFSHWLDARRIGVVLLGPGNGVTDRTRELVEVALKSNATVVLDADAMTAFMEMPQTLFDLIRAKDKGGCILTPHEAEFSRLFPVTGSKLERARAAARKSGAVVLLKGADTVIAAPDGQAIINANAPPYLATAGSGDVLAGIITGLATAGMPLFQAAAAAAWMHGDAGNRLGIGLIAEDIEKEIPAVLSRFL